MYFPTTPQYLLSFLDYSSEDMNSPRKWLKNQSTERTLLVKRLQHCKYTGQ